MSRHSGPLLLAFCALTFLSGCGDGPYRNLLFQAQTVNNQTYIVLLTRPALATPGDQGLFRIYRGSPDFLNWKPLDDNRTGPVFGTFVYKDEAGERLGLFHPQRVSFWKFSEDKIDVENQNLPFKWIAETGAQVKETLYVFGGREDPRGPNEQPTWRLVAACYDGKEFKELDDPGPVFKPGPQGFSLQAVEHNGKIHLFWRSAQEGGPIDLAPPVSFVGPLRMATFDGLSFGPEVCQFADLPQGHVEVWSDGTDLRALVQPQDDGAGRTPQLRTFTLGKTGTVREEIHMPYEAPMGLHFKYFTVTRLSAEGRTAFLRSNSQEFELWESVSGSWRVQPQPAGLPQQELMSLLLTVMVMCVCLIAMGVGMAIRRRRQMQWVLQRLRPQDVVAPLSLRISAYLVDLGILVGLTHLFCAVSGVPVPSWSLIFVEFQFVPVFGVLYLLYFTLIEWRFGRTAGKWLLGILVVTDQGEPPTLWAVFVRNLIGFFERLLVLPAVVSIMLTPRAQRIGDLLSRTLVVQRMAFNRYCAERQQAKEEKAQTPASGTAAPPADGSSAGNDGESKP